MWKCGTCGDMNGDGAGFCTSCGSKRLHTSGAATKLETAKPGEPMRRKLRPDYRSCYEAEKIEGVAMFLFVLSVVGGIIIFIASGFVPAISYKGELTTEFNFLTMLTKGTAMCAVCIISGHILRLVLEGFAIVVESAYRRMTEE